MKQNRKSKRESETPHVDRALARMDELLKPARIRAK